MRQEMGLIVYKEEKSRIKHSHSHSHQPLMIDIIEESINDI